MQCYRLGEKLHPLTIGQNAVTSFKSRTTLVPCWANTIRPGLFLQADYAIGGADGALGRGMGWQGMSFLATLHYGPDMHITSTFIPTLPGKLFYLLELSASITSATGILLTTTSILILGSSVASISTPRYISPAPF